MSPLPNYRPKQLSLGPLEAEILNIIWGLQKATAKDIHDTILSDPDRELAYASVMTVLRRLTEKGWLSCDKTEKSFVWQALVSQNEAKALFAYERLQQFLAVGKPEIIAGFADSLDTASLEQIEAIAQRIHHARLARKDNQ